MQSVVKREQALRRIRTTHALSQIQKLEPGALEHVVELALMAEDHANHWRAYEQLKKQVATFVGREAPKKELQTSEHYLTMLDFIDWLLPVTQEEMELLEFDEPLYDDEEEEPAFVSPRKVRRITSGFSSLGEIIESTLSETSKQIDQPEENDEQGEQG